MMARSHVLAGAAGWLAAAPQVAQATGHPLGPGTLAASTVVCAGAALLPDLDHEHGTLAHALGPVSKVATEIIADLSGGHRHATHSLVFGAGMGLLAAVALTSRWLLAAPGRRPAHPEGGTAAVAAAVAARGATDRHRHLALAGDAADRAGAGRGRRPAELDPLCLTRRTRVPCRARIRFRKSTDGTWRFRCSHHGSYAGCHASKADASRAAKRPRDTCDQGRR